MKGFVPADFVQPAPTLPTGGYDSPAAPASGAGSVPRSAATSAGQYSPATSAGGAGAGAGVGAGVSVGYGAAVASKRPSPATTPATPLMADLDALLAQAAGGRRGGTDAGGGGGGGGGQGGAKEPKMRSKLAQMYEQQLAGVGATGGSGSAGVAADASSAWRKQAVAALATPVTAAPRALHGAVPKSLEEFKKLKAQGLLQAPSRSAPTRRRGRKPPARGSGAAGPASAAATGTSSSYSAVAPAWAKDSTVPFASKVSAIGASVSTLPSAFADGGSAASIEVPRHVPSHIPSKIAKVSTGGDIDAPTQALTQQQRAMVENLKPQQVTSPPQPKPSQAKPAPPHGSLCACTFSRWIDLWT